MNKATGFAALLLICIVGQTDCTCVLESDFGFIVNCNFKKSGLFRVRNLGGLKAHFGLGFSLGDELGFAESLGNLEANKRRSLNLKTGASDIGVLPAANMVTTPIMPVKRVVQPLRQPEARKVEIPKMTIAAPLPLGVPAFKPIPLVKTDEGINKFLNQAMTLRQSLNADPYFAGPNSAVPLKTTPLRMVSVAQPKTNYPVYVPNTISRVFTESNTPTRVNDIQAMVSPLAHEFVAPHKNVERRHYNVTDSGPPKVDLKGHTVEELAEAANVTVAEIRAAIAKKQAILDDEYYSRQASNFVVPTEPASAEFTFDSQELLSLASSTARPRTKAPPSKYHITSNSGQKVMNAPKEYYPEGYDKNFDDNFTSRVDLPHTSFHCGDQKHFPGLYADEDLNCMVFHVCALTDDGLVMKSFLCPESTLFDQSILKCNWWFYVDCKTSKKLYDSNRPVSKSYQLVKALTYFSKKDNGSQQDLENTVPDTFDTGKK